MLSLPCSQNKKVISARSAEFVLPDDIWLLLARDLTLRDIYSVCATCRHLRGLYMNCGVLWRGVVDDLLAYSPNATITQLVQIADLVGICDRHRRTVQWLGHHSNVLTPIPKNSYTSFRLPPDLKDAQLLPGLPFMVGVSSDSAIRLLSAETGEITWSWRDSDSSQLGHVQVNVCASEQHGTMIMVVGDLACATTEFHRCLWLFAVRVELSSPYLVPLMTTPVDRFVETASARNGTMMYTVEEADHELVFVVVLDDIVDHGAPVEARAYRLSSKFRNQYINQIQVVSADVFCVFTSHVLALFRLPPHVPGTGTEPPLLVPYWTSGLDGLDNSINLGQLRTISEGVYILAFVSGVTFHTARLTPDSAGCELLWHPRGARHRPAEEHISVQGRHTCTVAVDSGALLARVARHAFFARWDPRIDRLPALRRGAPQEVQLQLPHDGDAEVWRVDFDEWTGTLAIQWWRGVEGANEDGDAGGEPDDDALEYFVTVVSMARPG